MESFTLNLLNSKQVHSNSFITDFKTQQRIHLSNDNTTPAKQSEEVMIYKILARETFRNTLDLHFNRTAKIKL